MGHVLATAQALQPARVVTVVRHERDLVAAEIAEQAPDAIVVDQDDVPELTRGVNSLGLYVASCDAFITIEHPEYFSRGWCLREMGINPPQRKMHVHSSVLGVKGDV